MKKDTSIGDVFPTFRRFFWAFRCKRREYEKFEDEEPEEVKQEPLGLKGLVANAVRSKVLQWMSSEEKLQAKEKESKKGFMKLGYGTVAYFNFHEIMIWMLLIICLFIIPSMILFASYKNGNRDKRANFLSKVTIGRLGFSKAYCKDINMESRFLKLKCFTGEIWNVHSFGIIPSDGHILDACEPNEETKRCDNAYN